MIEQTFGQNEGDAADRMIDLAWREDLELAGDLTTSALISADLVATTHVRSRTAGVIAGLPVARRVCQRFDRSVQFAPLITDGNPVRSGEAVLTLTGPVSALLTLERTLLNFLTHLSGIASLTRRYVDAVRGTNAQILDTRKTHPGYRWLEKYAVRCGGGVNHRFSLGDAVMIKDNHVAAWTKLCSLQAAVELVRAKSPPGTPIIVEIDRLEQLSDVFAGEPDVVLLDNMPLAELSLAVERRNREAPRVRLEASGGVNLETVRGIAETGVDRISIGALTHSAPALDLGLDWADG